MNMQIKYFSILILALMLVVTSGCSTPKPAGLSDEQLTSLAENILRNIDSNDYQKFGQDFSDDMKAAFTQEKFTQMQTMLQAASGKYVSIDKPALTNNQGYAVYRFPSKYENETVYVTITFLTGGQKVEGLFFDSVNLRELPK